MASQNTSAQQTAAAKGIGPHFSQDALTLLALYQGHGITHDEFRANLAKLQVDMEAWPEDQLKPIIYKVWRGLDSDMLPPDDEDANDLIVMPPPLPDPVELRVVAESHQEAE